MPSALRASRLTFGAGLLGMAFLATAGLARPAPTTAQQRPAAQQAQLTTARPPSARAARHLTALGAPTLLGPSTDAVRDPATGTATARRRRDVRRPHRGRGFAAAGPRVLSVVPAQGAPGWPVSLAGSRFRHVTSVSFGGVSASFTVISATRIVTTVPAGAPSAPVTVTTTSGRAQGPAFSVTPVQTLEPGETLPSADALVSRDGHYTLAMQGNGDLVYSVSGTSHRLWSTRTAGHPGAYVTMLSNGNLVVYAASGAAILWSSNTAGQGPARLIAQTDGRVTAYDGATPTWSTGGDNTTLLPGERLRPGWFLSSPSGDRLTMARSGDLIKAGPAGPAWSTGTAGHDGARLIMRTSGNLVLRGPARTLWSSQTAGHPGARLVLEPTGVLAVRYHGHALWVSAKAPTSPAPLTLGQWAGKAGPGAADTYYGYPYPDPPACTNRGGCLADQWAFYRGQCTSWVAYRVSQLNHIAFSNRYGGLGLWGDAVNWSARARKLKITVNDAPAVGSIAWYRSTRAAPDGHVAYVEKVISPTSIVISEMNYDGDNGFWVHAVTWATGDWPTRFIHLADR